LVAVSVAVGSGETVAGGAAVSVGMDVLVSVGDNVAVDRRVVVGNGVAVAVGLAVEPSLQLLIRVARVKTMHNIYKRMDTSCSLPTARMSLRPRI